MYPPVTAKQHIYQRLLMKVTDYRGLGSLEVVSDEAKFMLRELALQADFLHGIPRAIISAEVNDLDVDFLNRNARYYLASANPDWVNYQLFKVLIYQLYALVATQYLSSLTWDGPKLTNDERRIIGLAPENGGSD